MTTMTVRLTPEEHAALQAVCELSGKSRSEVVREALRDYRLRHALRESQAVLGPAARTLGWLTEDDILRDVA